MKLSRRSLLQLAPAAVAAQVSEPIERRAVVQRHNPLLRQFDPLSPLSVGNGEFAFTADATGLQTFPQLYDEQMPLCTMSQWGWHTAPGPSGLGPADLKLTPYDTFGRPVGYPTSPTGQKPLYDWLRENPHRLHLGRVGFAIESPAQITAIEQKLDLWTGILESRFEYQGRPFTVETACHPELDMIAVRVNGALPVRFAFPYGSPGMNAADWKQPDKHRSVERFRRNHLQIVRTLDADRYTVSIAWPAPASYQRDGPHEFLLKPANDRCEFVMAFHRAEPPSSLPGVQETLEASRKHWSGFWQSGAAIDFSAVSDPRARELERRVVLSQYLTAIQCAGSLPPQETGLTCNSWYGKYHLEMHYWHAAHFPLWGRTPLLERSLDWYRTMLPSAREKARSQGYAGVRWPKMTAPDGRDSPSPIGPLLIWQQPHPIIMADLCYRAQPSGRTRQRFSDLVFESAEFMASYAHEDPKSKRFVLGPPVIPAQENHPPRETWNPTFELEYWAWGLEIANRWREQLGMQRNAKWDDVRRRLAPLPVKDGVYLAHENCPQTFIERNRDHPSMLGALGVLPGAMVDRETMRRTLRRTFAEWRWDDTWGWDFPMVAMTAASLGEPALAIDALLMRTPKNTWRTNGHNWQRANLPLYLPGNGGLLLAIAHMAGLSAFPPEWKVRRERLPAVPLY